MVDDGAFQRLVAILLASKPAVEDVWIFTENDGQDFRYIDLAEVRRRASFIAGRIQALRAAGFRVSINVLNTIGHSDYAEQDCDPLPWSGVVAPDGAMSTCCSCPRQPGFRAYVVEKYTAFAGCRPEQIWVDDDVRLFGHFWKAMHGCYCPMCLDEFSRRVGRSWNRSELYQAITRDTYPEVNAERAAWMGFLSDQIVDIHQLIRETVRQVDPHIVLGGMNTGFHWGSAYYARFAERYEALRVAPETPVHARPGGGAFHDDRPVEAFHKAWAICLQNTLYPPLTVRHAEIENYPFQLFEKSVASTVSEASLYIATGCEGIACDLMGNLGNDPAEHAPYLAALAAHRPYLEALRSALAGATAIGLAVACHPEHAALSPANGTDLSSTDASRFFEACGWGFLGIPLRFTPTPEAPCLLHGQLAKGLPRTELASILRGGAILDGEALAHIWQVGLGPLVGARIVSQHDGGTYESFAEHPINAGFTGYVREVSQGYYRGIATVIEAAGATLQPLSLLRNYRRRDLGVCSATILHPSGSRFAILGYRPWDYLGLPGIRARCRGLVDWLHQDRFPIRQLGGGKAVMLAHATPAGGCVASLFNASSDPLVTPVIASRFTNRRVRIHQPGAVVRDQVSSAEGVVILPDLPAWGECFISMR